MGLEYFITLLVPHPGTHRQVGLFSLLVWCIVDYYATSKYATDTLRYRYGGRAKVFFVRVDVLVQTIHQACGEHACAGVEQSAVIAAACQGCMGSKGVWGGGDRSHYHA